MLNKFLQTSVLTRRVTWGLVLVGSSIVPGTNVSALTLGAPSEFIELGQGNTKGVLSFNVGNGAGYSVGCEGQLNEQGAASCEISTKDDKTLTVAKFRKEGRRSMYITILFPASIHDQSEVTLANALLDADLAAMDQNLNMPEVLNNSAYIIVPNNEKPQKNPYKLQVTWWTPSSTK